MGPTCDAPGQWCTPTGATDAVCAVPDPTILCPYSIVGYNGGTCPDASVMLDQATCTFQCGSAPGADCVPPAPLQPGYLSQYIDTVTVSDGAGGEFVAISGYDPGWLDISNQVWKFGDLVYVEYRPGDAETPPATSYTIIDGKPANSETNVYFDPAGWRQGNYEPGDDVGYYSSIAASAAGDIYIAYVDLTTPGSYRLKLAHRAPASTTWTINLIDDSPLVGTGGAFYPSLTLDSTGKLVVAYGVRQAATGPGLAPQGWVRIATSSNPNPTGVADWTSFDMVESIANVGCVDGDGLCAAGDRCFAAGTSGRGVCLTPTNDCTMACAGQFGSEVICANTVCQTVRKAGDLVDTTGIFNQLVADGTGLALAYHDRSAGTPLAGMMCSTDANCPAQAFCSGAVANMANSGTCMIPNGNIWGARFSGGTWSPRFLIDGYSRKVATVGDCGQHLTFTIDASGVWHVAYLDGTFDRIRYAQVQTNNTVNNYQFVDDGTAAFAPALTDRQDGNRRLVGGEMSIQLSSAGELRILYQDLTGPASTDPTVQPVGPQPLIATRAAAANTGFAVAYPATRGPNSGFWISQSLGITAGTNNTSYCVWAQRSANLNDPLVPPVEDGALIHVTTCRP